MERILDQLLQLNHSQHIHHLRLTNLAAWIYGRSLQKTPTFQYILQKVTHPQFTVSQPGTSCFRLDATVTSEKIHLIIKKMCHRNHMAKFPVTNSLSSAISQWQWTFSRLHFFRHILNIRLDRGQLSWYSVQTTSWTTENRCSNSDTKIYLYSSKILDGICTCTKHKNISCISDVSNCLKRWSDLEERQFHLPYLRSHLT